MTKVCIDLYNCHQHIVQMSYLQRIQAQNKKQFDRAKLFLLSKQIDTNNLPNIQANKPTQINHQQRNQQDASNVSSEDSLDFDIIAYLKNKRGKNNSTSVEGNLNDHYNQNSKSNEVPKYQENNFSEILSEYSFTNNQDSQSQIQNHFQKHQIQQLKPKANRIVKQRKQIHNGRLKPINKEEITNLATIDTVFKCNTPLRINYIQANNKQWQDHKKQENYRLQYLLKKFPSIKEFKNNQKAIIKCGLEGHNIFVCMPTGGGKSLTFQLLTFLIKGVYLCILPLISLIFDQQRQAKMLGIEAYSLTANTNQSDVKLIYNKLYDFENNQKSIVIFCTPQKLNLSQNFSQLLDMLYKKQQLKRVIIDQVHCVSTWGKQFRIQYQNLSSIKKRFPKTPILALTATVTEVVKQDIISRLGIANCYFFQSSFNRANLYYEVKPKDKNVLQQIQKILHRHKDQTGIIYCLSRKQCEQVSFKLNQKGFKTAFYHADIPKEQKQFVQESWMNDTILVIVATVAFGMGINKPDVRFVIHHTMSKSLENYYQESGRAGRDGFYADCILFYKKADKLSLLGMTFRNDFSTLANKQFSTKQLAQMIKYCEDKTLCRRQMQLRYLGETDFNSKDCNKTCDNCKESQHYNLYECINEGKIIIRALMKIEEAKVPISKNQFINILRNKIEKNIKYKSDQMQRGGLDFQQLSATFEGWKVDELQILILQLISNDIMTERVVQNMIVRNKKQSSIINLYIKCNVPRCQMFLDRVQTLPIPRQIKKYQRLNFQEDQNESGEQLQSQKSLQDDSNEKFIELTEEEKNIKYRQLLSSIFEDNEEQDPAHE